MPPGRPKASHRRRPARRPTLSASTTSGLDSYATLSASSPAAAGNAPRPEDQAPYQATMTIRPLHPRPDTTRESGSGPGGHGLLAWPDRGGGPARLGVVSLAGISGSGAPCPAFSRRRRPPSRRSSSDEAAAGKPPAYRTPELRSGGGRAVLGLRPGP